MKSINRSQAPVVQPIQEVDLLQPNVFSIGKNAEWIWMQEVNDETVQLNLVFDAGSIQGDAVLIASTVNKLLFSGTHQKDSTTISDELSKLGAYYSTKITREEAFVSVYCLREYFDEVLGIIVDAIENVVFPEDEITEYRQDQKQAFLIGEKKSAVVASRKFTNLFFQQDERYSRTATLADYDFFTRNQLIEFHREYYLKGLKSVICIAKVEEQQVQKWIKRFEPWNNQISTTYLSIIEKHPISVYQELEAAVQTSIFVAFPLFNQLNENYPKLSVLNTVLGGYFGSRLMANLREDKGYTYGVNSLMQNFFETGYLYIRADVKKESREDAIQEIKRELKRLQEENITEHELELVRNYIVGKFLEMADGSDAMTYLFVGARKMGLTTEYYKRFLQEVKTVTVEELKAFAKQYLDFDDATIVQVG